MELNIISLTEANLNRVVAGKDKAGYAILSASSPISKESIDVDNIRTNELLSFLNISNCTYVPVYGEYKNTYNEKVYIDRAFIVLPYKRSTNEYMDFDSFAEKVLKVCHKIYHQDAILIKYPDKEPVLYDYRVKHTQSIGFSSTNLYDVTKEFFTVLEKCGDISLKSPDTFEKENSQNITFEKAYMNDFPNSISEHRIRSSRGELVRFKNYPEEK